MAVWRALMIACFAVTLVVVAGVLAGLYVFVYQPQIKGVAEAELARASEQVSGELRSLVRRVEILAQLNREWGRLGLIKLDEPERFNHLLRPVIARGHGVFSFVLADDTGRELLLLQRAGGGWLNRFTDPARRPGRATLVIWADDGLTELSREDVALEYDARKRDWFKGSMAQADPQDVFWTLPYTFRSTNEPGMSAVVRWAESTGRTHVMTSDIRLTDISRVTSQLTVADTGIAAVLSSDGRVVGLPRDSRFRTEGQHVGRILLRPDELGLPTLQHAYQALGRLSKEADLAHFDSGGKPWLASFRPVHVGNQSWWVVALAPESDFGHPTSVQLATVAAIACMGLVLAWMAARWMARRFTVPLEQLACESARIGRLELEHPVRVKAPLHELRDLAAAQEAMRVQLRATTRGLEQANKDLAAARDTLEAKVALRTAEVERARSAADAAAAARAAFLANMSHEIRTPLNAVLGFAQLLLLTPQLSERQRDQLHRIEEAGRLLLSIINDVLDFSKIDAGKMELHEAPVVMDDLLREVAHAVEPMLRGGAVELVMLRDAAVPDGLSVDGLRLKQVLINLASNAAKFTSHGEVFVGVRVRTEDMDGPRVEFIVQDTGIGMSDEQQRRLFDAFVQADASTTHRYGGTGLGLAISERLVRLMGGSIAVRSSLGQGSEFRFSVPMRAAPSAASTARRRYDGVRALVVAANQLEREALVSMLESFGILVSPEVSPRTALSAVRQQAASDTFAISFIDCRQTGGSGWALASELVGAGVGAAVVLGYAFERDAQSLDAADDSRRIQWMEKPVVRSALLEALEQRLGRSAGQATSPAALPASDDVPLSARVLLVEDNPPNQMMTREMLESFGLSVSLAEDGAAALDVLRRGERFDLVLMDLQMPRMDGMATAKAIRALPGHERLVIIAMTADVLTHQREACLRAGMDDYVTKPIDAKALRERIARWMHARAV